MIHCAHCLARDFEALEAEKFRCKTCGKVSRQSQLLIPLGEATGQAKRFSHPIRVAVMGHLLAQGEMSPNMIARASGIPIGNVAYHVRQLSEVGAIKETRRVPVRGAMEHFFRAIPLAD
jgi:DNA-binding transcriptional ArsR family regulator